MAFERNPKRQPAQPRCVVDVAVLILDSSCVCGGGVARFGVGALVRGRRSYDTAWCCVACERVKAHGDFRD